jgi:hypothetical protein
MWWSLRNPRRKITINGTRTRVIIKVSQSAAFDPTFVTLRPHYGEAR